METIGRYQVVRQLGHGGMGRVYLARDPSLERDVALKVLHREAKQAGLREEAKALAALNHPSIVTVYEIGEQDGQDFIAMEYLPGRSLRHLINEPQRAARRAQLLAICSKVAVALAAAHRAGILHRDIKPENIIVSAAGDVKVVDFGIARRLERVAKRPSRAVTAQELADVLTRSLPAVDGADTIVSAGTETMFGTPAYMAPEVLLGEGSSEPSDVYSLGIVIYECVVGRRPYAGSSLHEVIAQMIEGPSPQLSDPLGPLVGRMLAREPEKRPDLAAVRAALAPRAGLEAPPARRGWLPLVVGAALIAGAVVTWRVMTGEPPPPPPPPAAPALVAATLAIAPIAVEIPSYGAEPARPAILADTLAKLLGEVAGVRLAGVAIPIDATDPRANARSLHAEYVVTIKIVERDRLLHATGELADTGTGARVKALELTAPSPQLAQLIDAIAEQLGAVIAPGAHLERAPNRVRAQLFYRQGRDILESAHFTDARPYLEQAVDADPTFFEGWYSLALVLGWMEAPEALIQDAVDKALAAAAPGPKQELMHGVASYMRGEYTQARLTFEPLLKATGVAAPDPKELDYYLGEANWHDGRHTVAVDYFQRALLIDKQFRPAAVHIEQYALARRDEKLARYVIGLQAEESEPIEMAIRHYREVANGSKFPYNLHSQLILGDKPSPDLEARMEGPGIAVTAYRIARAVEAGDLPRAHREFAELWQRDIAGKQLDPNQLYELENLGEVVLAAGWTDEARQLVGFLAAASEGKHPAVRGYQRFAALAAGVTGDASLIAHDGITERNARIAEAMEAELAKDHGKAARLLDELVHDPTAFWDYPERAALVRNWKALGKKKELAALCEQTGKPAIYRHAYLVVRAQCRAIVR